MLKATDEVKKIFKRFINVEPIDYKYGFVLHPVFQNRMYVYDMQMNHIDVIEETERALEILMERMDKFQEVEMMVEMIRKPWRLDFMEELQGVIPHKLFSELLRYAYTSTEFPNWTYWQNGKMDVLLQMFEYADKSYVMSDDEMGVWKNLPKEIEIYRGIDGRNETLEEDYPAMSWTIDIEQAKWFSKRFHSQGRLVKAKIKREDTFAYIEREKEIIIDYTMLYDIEEA